MSKTGYIACIPAENTQAPECSCNDSMTLTGKDDVGCQFLLQQVQTLPRFTQTQVKALQQILTNAQAKLKTAKKHVDNWDKDAQDASFKFFGNSDADTKTKVSAIINAELSLLNNMGNVEQHIFTDRWAALGEHSPIPKWAAAYVVPAMTPDNYPMVFLMPIFWKASSDWQSMAMVHELSHLNYAGGAQDLAYGENNCRTLAFFGNLSKTVTSSSNFLKSIGLGNGGGSLPFSLAKPSEMQDPRKWELAAAPTPTNAALINADSIALFVDQLSKK